MAIISIPSPGAAPAEPQQPIPGPSEAAFTSTFGTLLPSAQYLTTPTGKAAYYELSPSSTVQDGKAPERVLFVHGVQTPALGMLPLAKALQSSFPQSHFVLVDLWGHGLSETPLVPHEPALFTGLVDALLDQLGWASAHFVGYSFGSVITVHYSLAKPERVSSFTLVAPAGLIPHSSLSDDDKAHLNGDDETAGQEWTVRWLEGGDLVVPSDWEEKVAKGHVVADAVKKWQMSEHAGHTASVRAIIRDGRVFDVGSKTSYETLAKKGIPYYGIVGDSDPVCGEAQLKGAGFEHVAVVKGAGHGVVREQEDQVAALIADFWRR